MLAIDKMRECYLLDSSKRTRKIGQMNVLFFIHLKDDEGLPMLPWHPHNSLTPQPQGILSDMDKEMVKSKYQTI